ncbi:Dbl-domain containing protein [Ascosphaera apis ARSEF 7405]|uniref:Dbl-domain containing protein n=1 Tax=Ascosphaera apis ARSEF 7405 TaxID=392613 RepID=A0A167WD78_9EURO|nr:Dbl-domain containing protein [Ascosphaera apis ARSEF 7405]
MTVESGLKIEDAIAGRSGVPEREGFPIAQIVIKEDEEDDMNGVCTESSPKQPNGSIGQTGKVNDHEKEQLLKKRRSQIFQQTMSRRSEEHEREPMPPNVVDAISAAQRQLHRPSKRWTVVSRESSVVSDALSILSHSRRQSISSRKGEDLTTSGTGTSPKSHRILSRRHSKQSSEDSTSNLCLSEHDERRSTDTNDLDADPFDDRDASNVVLPYSNESSMHVLQQHYPEICLTDTNKVQQEKASKRMTQLFLSELSKGGFDTTLLTRPELNTGRHSINRFRLSQHRRKDSDISWTSHEHDNASIGTQESFDHRGDNQQLNAEPRLSIHEAPLETPRTLHNFKNAHPEHAELGIPIELGSPTSFTLPLTRDRSSHADSFRSSLTRPRSGSIDLTISPTRSPPTPPPPSSPTPQRSCSPSIMSSMAGVSSRRSSLLSVSSSNRTYIDGLANQLNQNYQLQFPSRKNEDLEATKHTSRMSSINEQGLAPTEITASTRYSGSTLRDKRTSTRDADYKRLKQRRNIIKELIDTEHRFTQDMTIVVEFYMHTAPSCSGMTPENTKTLFGNADKVFQFTTMFQDELKHAARSVYSLPHSQRYQSKRAGSRPSSSMDMNNGNGTVELSDENDRKTTIGMAFMSYAQRMEEVYAEYLKNHDSANKMLDMLQKREVVQLWLTECKGLAVGLTDAWDLDSLLVKPVQRMLKYPLLLTELLSVTPQDHPDYVNLQSALKETTSISVRINESKKRADVVGQVIHSSTRRRRESDVRAGLTKAFTWRGDKHKHHAERYNDHEFDLLANQFGENFFHTSLIIRDVDDYIIKVQRQVQKFYAYVTSINAFVESHEAQNQKPERKWHKFAKTVKHLMDKALTEHIAAVRKGVSQPMYQLLKLHDGPQRVMQKRNKRYIDYTRYRYIQDRHEKPDHKTVEQAEQFDALNITLKEELPRLFKLSAKLMRELLGVFGHLQAVWNLEMQSRLSYILGNSIDYMPGEDLRLISDHWAEKFNPSEKLVTALSICNGTLLADNVTGLSLGPAAQIGHSGRPSTMSNIYLPTGSSMTQTSPKYSQDQSSRSRSSSNLFSKVDLSMSLGNSSSVSRVYTPATTYSPTLSPSDHQLRGSETCRGSSGADVPQLPPIAPLPPLPTTTSSISALPGLSLTVPSTGDAPMRTPRLGISQPLSAASSTNFLNSPVPMRAPSPQPDTNSQTHRQASTVGSSGSSLVDFKSIFPVISLCPFDIEPNRIANGYPYLSYKAGEAFGVVGEKGDLWLAWNEADPSHTVGWIWTKHFEKVQH